MSWHHTLQAGTLDSSSCSPEGERYMSRRNIARRALKRELLKGGLRALQIVDNHEPETDRDSDPRSPSQQISAAPLAYVGGSPVRHQAAKHIACRHATEVSVVVGAAKNKAEDSDINQPANQRASQSLRGHALSARCSREQHSD